MAAELNALTSNIEATLVELQRERESLQEATKSYRDANEDVRVAVEDVALSRELMQEHKKRTDAALADACAPHASRKGLTESEEVVESQLHSEAGMAESRFVTTEGGLVLQMWNTIGQCLGTVSLSREHGRDVTFADVTAALVEDGDGPGIEIRSESEQEVQNLQALLRQVNESEELCDLVFADESGLKRFDHRRLTVAQQVSGSNPVAITVSVARAAVLDQHAQNVTTVKKTTGATPPQPSQPTRAPLYRKVEPDASMRALPRYVQVARDLWRQNYCVVDDFLTDQLCQQQCSSLAFDSPLSAVDVLDAMREGVLGAFSAGEMHPGMIASQTDDREAVKAPDVEKRSDFVKWWNVACAKEQRKKRVVSAEGGMALTPDDAFAVWHSAILDLIHDLSAFMSGPNETVDLNHTSNIMTAVYDKHAKYVRHVDNPDGDGRQLSLVFYLNPGWIAKYGGALQIYGPQKEDSRIESLPVVRVPPVGNRLVVFWADARCPHEVLPVAESAPELRCTATVWAFSRFERMKAEQSGDTSHSSRITADARRVAAQQ